MIIDEDISVFFLYLIEWKLICDCGFHAIFTQLLSSRLSCKDDMKSVVIDKHNAIEYIQKLI